MTYAERATEYAQAVMAGEVLAGRYVRLACERHLADLADEGGPYRFDHKLVDRICKFIELLPHVKGKWAQDHSTIRLEDWQCFMVGVPFGWVKKSDGMRRFRRVYCEVPRKNAKSTISAAVGLYALVGDKEPGAEVYCGAGSEKQAWEVFRPARQMASRTTGLVQATGMEVNAKTLAVPTTGSRFEPVIGKPGDGASPHLAIVDEYHEHADEQQYDTFMTGMGAREQPLLWTITTAGSDTAGPCYALRQEVVEVLEGKVYNPELFGIVYTLDEGDDWRTEDALRKANPNYGVSVGGEYLLGQQRDALNNPRKQSTFLTKHLNVWVGAASPYFNSEKWRQLGDKTLRMSDFVGDPCYIGVDLAAKVDIAAVVALFRRDIDGVDHYYAFPHFYVPEATVEQNRAYAGWSHEGYMTTTPGNITNFGQIEDDLAAWCEQHNVVHAAFDQWNSMQMSVSLAERTGIECVDIPMSTKHISDPMKWVQALIEDGRLHHDANPVMAWMVGNVTAQEDRNDNVFPRKERRENKIDGVVALIMAMERGFQSEADTSYLDLEDLLVL